MSNLTYLVEVDDGLPELVLQLVEIPHANLPKVPRMVLIQVRPMMMLPTSHSTTTRVLAMLSYAPMAG